jgi:DNA-binding CsgD family transcriptional regulator
VNREGVGVERHSRVFVFQRTGGGRKCWNCCRDWNAFGNQYCCERCPLREMAFQHKPVNRCRMSFRTADGELQGFTVTTLALFDTRDATLIHLCRKEPAADHEVADHAARRESGRSEGPGVLTPRERQVLNHLAAGRTTREIAALLSISVPTVRSHVERILHKLHAHSRLEAVAVGRRLELN